VAHVMHEDDAEVGALAHRISKEATIHVSVATGLEHERTAQFIAVLFEPFPAGQDGVTRDAWVTAGDDAEWLAASVNLDGADGACDFHGTRSSVIVLPLW